MVCRLFQRIAGKFREKMHKLLSVNDTATGVLQNIHHAARDGIQALGVLDRCQIEEPVGCVGLRAAVPGLKGGCRRQLLQRAGGSQSTLRTGARCALCKNPPLNSGFLS